jgi:hypothetical protein
VLDIGCATPRVGYVQLVRLAQSASEATLDNRARSSSEAEDRTGEPPSRMIASMADARDRNGGGAVRVPIADFRPQARAAGTRTPIRRSLRPSVLPSLGDVVQNARQVGRP